MRNVTPTAARDQVAPALHKAQETLTDTVIPTVRDAIATAFEKSSELLDSDAAWEARRRGTAIVKAARGDVVVPAPAGRRWRFGLGMLGLGAGIGFAIAKVMKSMAAPVDSYTTTPSFSPTAPVASGTDGGVTGSATSTSNGASSATSATSAASADTKNEDIDLRSGTRTNL